MVDSKKDECSLRKYRSFLARGLMLGRRRERERGASLAAHSSPLGLARAAQPAGPEIAAQTRTAWGAEGHDGVAWRGSISCGPVKHGLGRHQGQRAPARAVYGASERSEQKLKRNQADGLKPRPPAAPAPRMMARSIHSALTHLQHKKRIHHNLRAQSSAAPVCRPASLRKPGQSAPPSRPRTHRLQITLGRRGRRASRGWVVRARAKQGPRPAEARQTGLSGKNGVGLQRAASS